MKKKNSAMITSFVRDNQLSHDDNHKDFVPMLSIASALVVMVLMAFYYYGARALLVAAVCVAASWGSDIICLILRGKRLHIHDISPIVTGLSIAVMLPASVPYSIAALACVFAVCVAKHPFGGHGFEIFNCAAAGYVFAEISFPQAVLRYPKPFSELPASNIAAVPLYSANTGYSVVSDKVTSSDLELLIGNYCGPMGCTFIILTFVCALVLISRKAVSPLVFFPQMLLVFLWELLTDGADGVKLAAAGGMLIFAASVLSSDSAVIPQKNGSQLLYGMLCGALIIAVSEISAVGNPSVYAVIIAAPFGKLIGSRQPDKERRSRVKKIFGDGENGAINETISMIKEDGNVREQ